MTPLWCAVRPMTAKNESLAAHFGTAMRMKTGRVSGRSGFNETGARRAARRCPKLPCAAACGGGHGSFGYVPPYPPFRWRKSIERPARTRQ
jgi:hypothetical protein